MATKKTHQPNPALPASALPAKPGGGGVPREQLVAGGLDGFKTSTRVLYDPAKWEYAGDGVFVPVGEEPVKYVNVYKNTAVGAMR